MAEEVKEEITVSVTLDEQGIPQTKVDGKLIKGLTREHFIDNAKVKAEGEKAFLLYRADSCDRNAIEMNRKSVEQTEKSKMYRLEAENLGKELSEKEKNAAKMAKLEAQLAKAKARMEELA